jgi:hypothetical protein
MLALNICEVVIALQRPYFTQALCKSPDNLPSSKYYSSYLATFERCTAYVNPTSHALLWLQGVSSGLTLTRRRITAIVQSLHNLYPAVTFRHWNFWYHLFTAAVCFSTVVLLAPRSLLSPFAISELQVIVDLFAQAPVGSRPRANLDALIKIQQKTHERFNAASAPSQSLLNQLTSVFGVPSVGSSAPDDTFDEDVDTHVAMMGWDTRLVRRLHAGAASRGVSIPRPAPPAHSHRTREPSGRGIHSDLQAAHQQPVQTSTSSNPLWASLPGVSTHR